LVITYNDAANAAIATAAGVGYLQLGGSYFVLAGVGGLIGLIHWFHAMTHAEPKWSRSQSASEAAKSIFFGLVVMPAAIDMAGPLMKHWGLVATPSTIVLIGAVASFSAVEIFSLGLNFLKRKAGD